MEEVTEKKVVNVLPLGKGKRILAFLADFFLNFIFAFLLFVIAAFPLGKAFTDFNAKQTTYFNNLDKRAEVLIGNKLIFDSGDVEISDIQYNLDYTSDCFLSYYAFSEETPSNAKYNQFGHKAENQVLHTYFLSIVNEEEKFISLFDKYNSKKSLFERSGTTITLKADVVDQVAPNFIKNESVSKVGKTYISDIKNTVFLPMFSEIMDSVSKNDLTYNEISYNAVHKQVLGFENYVRKMITYVSLITVFISTFILYFVIPIVNRSRKTLGMMIMKIERVNIFTFNHLKKRELLLSLIYQFFIVFIISFFIPMTSISFAEMFRIQLLFFIGMFSIFMMVINFIFLMFDQYNRTLFDRLLSSVYMSNAELDDIYRAKGYDL